jgi:4-diphosphocytidyl-2-C-methyl-D-erythritol kinase
LDAPCKINLHLRIKERRADGFHDLESIFLALAFGDTLHFELGEAGGAVELETEYGLPQEPGRKPGGIFEDIPGGDNSVLKAAALFKARTGFDRSLRIRLEKRVPLGAGLGGGSSDGAATLLALNRLAEQAGLPTLDQAGLERAAAELGSDAPFFLGVLSGGAFSGGAAWVAGRGERIRPVEGPRNCAVALVNPGFPSNTAEAYRLLDARRSSRGLPFREGPSEQALIGALPGPSSRWPYTNDFLELFLEERDPRSVAYREILEGLRSRGADFCGLTGSGSTCFGIFAGRGAAEAALSGLLGLESLAKQEIFTALTFPLAFLGKRVV